MLFEQTLNILLKEGATITKEHKDFIEVINKWGGQIRLYKDHSGDHIEPSNPWDAFEKDRSAQVYRQATIEYGTSKWLRTYTDEEYRGS